MNVFQPFLIPVSVSDFLKKEFADTPPANAIEWMPVCKLAFFKRRISMETIRA